MTIKLESARCKNQECDIRAKHWHATYLSESNGIVVNIGSPETFYSISECRQYCKEVPGVEWEDKTKQI